MVSLYMYNVHAGSELCQWSVKDITTSGSYQAKKEKVFTTPSTISWYMCIHIYTSVGSSVNRLFKLVLTYRTLNYMLHSVTALNGLLPPPFPLSPQSVCVFAVPLLSGHGGRQRDHRAGRDEWSPERGSRVACGGAPGGH